MELDFEDYVEEIKFQLTLFDDMEERDILEFETKLREFASRHKSDPHIRFRAKDDITVTIRSEEDMERIAVSYRRALKQNAAGKFWEGFRL